MNDDTTVQIIGFVEELDLTSALFARDALDARIGMLKEEARTLLMKNVAAEAAKLGISGDDLFGPSVARRTLKPKYRNPHNQTETWTGRGKPPTWFSAALDAGVAKRVMQITPDQEIPFPE